MATNLNVLKTQAYKLKKKIYSGEVKGKALRSTREKFNAVMRDIRHAKPVKVKTKKTSAKGNIPLVTIKAKPKGRISKKAPKHQFVQEQGFIPGFLKMMNMVKIEEMVAQKLFNEIKAQIEGLSVQEVEAKKAQ